MLTTNTTMTTVDLTSPIDTSNSPAVHSNHLVTQSAPNTPVAHREARERSAGVINASDIAIALPPGKALPTSYYKAGLGSIYEGIFSCFKPVWGYFGKANGEITRSLHDDWEIPFEAISDLCFIGSGSQGAVYKGVLNSKVVAVKKVNNSDEIKIRHLKHLDHENIIKFMGVCTQAPCYAVIMEFCSNGPLCGFLKSEMRFTQQQWAEWALQIADGMVYLHKNNVIHRDLKSPNILINDVYMAKICDFGTSHEQKKPNSTVMSCVGTFNWMAPEVIKKEKYTEKVDVFSFGVVLWEMLTREVPYKNIEPMAIMFGVGNGTLFLPIPKETPGGLQLLLKQCWAPLHRNRPSFTQVVKHLEIVRHDLDEIPTKEWDRLTKQWRDEIADYTYPDSLTSKSIQQGNEERELVRKRKEELKHAHDIRGHYELKLKRANNMYSKLNYCMSEIQLREKELDERERYLENLAREMGVPRSRGSSISSLGKPMVARVGNRHQEVYCSAISHHSMYGAMEVSSSEEEDYEDYHRGSPNRGSQASFASSGFPSSQSACFSRQSSSRSSSGLPRKLKDSPIRVPHGSPFTRDVYVRHSSSSQYGVHGADLVRGSPARMSGMSEDSGVQMSPWMATDASGSCGRLTSRGEPVCYSQAIYRNAEGRWSDGKIASRRKPRRPVSMAPGGFQRDSPARTPSNRNKAQRASYHNAEPTEECSCEGACCRKQRAKSMFHERMEHSPTPYDNPTELNVADLPHSTSYQEALRQHDSLSPTGLEAKTDNERTPVHQRGHANPLFVPAITTYINPIASPQVSPQHARKFSATDDALEKQFLSAVDPNVDLYSSLDSNNPQTHRSRQSDASAEESTEEDREEENGNVLDSSLDSQRAKKSFADEDEYIRHRRHHELQMAHSTSTMTSSLERSLERGALHSDGLSDREREVRAVKNSIKGHRRSHSGNQASMAIVDETSSESDESVDI